MVAREVSRAVLGVLRSCTQLRRHSAIVSVNQCGDWIQFIPFSFGMR